LKGREKLPDGPKEKCKPKKRDDSYCDGERAARD